MLEAIYLSMHHDCVKRRCIVMRLHLSLDDTHAQLNSCLLAFYVPVETTFLSLLVNGGYAES